MSSPGVGFFAVYGDGDTYHEKTREKKRALTGCNPNGF